MNKEHITEIFSVLSEVEDYLYNELDVICDEDFLDDTNQLLNRIRQSKDLLERNYIKQ